MIRLGAGGHRTGAGVAVVSLIALALGVLLILALHLVPPTNEISPIRRTISEYQLSVNRWLFDLAVLLVAAGSAIVFVELVRHRLVRPLSAGVLFGALWTVGLVVLVAFTKTDWSFGPSLTGTIHRYASAVSFVALPLAVLVVAGVVFPGPAGTGWRLLARGLATVSLLWFGVIVLGVLRMLAGGGPWWRFAPLGLVERGIAVTAVAAIAVIGVGVVRRRAGWRPAPAADVDRPGAG